jgi:signal transduction histidine kinase
MLRGFVGRASGLAVLVGCIFVSILAAFSYSLLSAFRKNDEALRVYSQELFLAKSLQEAVQRKLASGRGFLLAHDAASARAMDEADIDVGLACAALRSHAKSSEGIELLTATERDLEDHDRALKAVMRQDGSVGNLAKHWSTEVAPRAVTVRQRLDEFIHEKQRLADDAASRAHHEERRAKLMTGSIAFVALVGGGLGASRLLRSVRRRFAAETDARAAAEKQRAFYTAMVDQLPLGIVLAEAPSGRILHINHWARRILARVDPRAAEVHFVGEYMKWPVIGADGEPLPLRRLPLMRALEGEVVFDEPVRFGPQQRVYSVTAGPIRDESGKIIAAVVGFSDVTAKKRTERERELFIGALGHDLRNPLNAISLIADTLVHRCDLPDDATAKAGRIGSSARRMNKLIGDLLDFARSQHGAMRLNPEPCELSELAADVIAEVQAANPGRTIRLSHTPGCEGRWDRARLMQVLSNLVMNAVAHGAPDHPIDLRTSCDDRHACLRITNHGEPIPPDELLHLFEPFRTGGKSRGVGLGLYIAHSIVEAHGGIIEVQSAAGETTFTVRLPFDPPSQTTLRA